MGRTRLICALVYGFLLMVADGIFTHIFISRHGSTIEANPIARWIIENYGLSAFHIQKILLSALGLYIFYLVYKMEGMTRQLLLIIAIVLTAYTGLVIYEVIMLTKGY
jgi:hypothetical protein